MKVSDSFIKWPKIEPENGPFIMKFGITNVTRLTFVLYHVTPSYMSYA